MGACFSHPSHHLGAAAVDQKAATWKATGVAGLRHCAIRVRAPPWKREREVSFTSVQRHTSAPIPPALGAAPPPLPLENSRAPALTLLLA